MIVSIFILIPNLSNLDSRFSRLPSELLTNRIGRPTPSIKFDNSDSSKSAFPEWLKLGTRKLLKCDISDSKIIDNKNGELFDKMLSSIKLDRKQISLASYIPRGIGEFENDHKMITTLQLINYRLIELINPKYLIIMSNYCIKMLLAADLSSMSLRGKWFDFNTPNDVVPKKCRVLYEPSLLINNPDLKKDAWEDLKEIKKQLGG